MKKLIVARGLGNEIGSGSELPWGMTMKDDLSRFKSLTNGSAILMGRSTLESIGRALPNRHNIVLASTTQTMEGVHTVSCIEEGFKLGADLSEHTFVIGGARLYKASLDQVDTIHETVVHGSFTEANVFFDPLDLSRWHLTGSSHHAADERNAFSYVFNDFVPVSEVKNTKLPREYYDNSTDLIADLLTHRANGQRVVLTQGVYDLIHEGHANYLALAKSHGDILIVGVDSDELTRQRKGPNRPIVPESERIRMLLHLEHVDAVVLRSSGEDIGHLIRSIKPDTLITSTTTKDFDEKLALEYGDVCGEIVTLPPQSTTSTTARIRDLTIDGVSEVKKVLDEAFERFVVKLKGQV